MARRAVRSPKKSPHALLADSSPQGRGYRGRAVSDYVYTMYRADKFYGPDRQVLADISLSFLPGAKIGVLGPNGASRSTLLRIMAGREEQSSGLAQLAPGATVGLLEQEPLLDPRRTSRATSKTASGRSATYSIVSPPSPRPSPSPLPVSTRCSASRAASRRRSTAAARGRSTRRSTPRWTPSGSRTGTAT